MTLLSVFLMFPVFAPATQYQRLVLDEFREKLSDPEFADALRPCTTTRAPVPELGKRHRINLGRLLSHSLNGRTVREARGFVFPGAVCVECNVVGRNGHAFNEWQNIGYFPSWFANLGCGDLLDPVRYALFDAMVRESQADGLVGLRTALICNDKKAYNEAFLRLWDLALQEPSEENMPGLVRFARRILAEYEVEKAAQRRYEREA